MHSRICKGIQAGALYVPSRRYTKSTIADMAPASMLQARSHALSQPLRCTRHFEDLQGKHALVTLVPSRTLTDSTIAEMAPASMANVELQEKVGAPHCAKYGHLHGDTQLKHWHAAARCCKRGCG